MGALMLLQAAEAFFVAANTAVDLLDLPGSHLVRPFRVSQQLAAHGSTGDASACKLLLYKIRLIQSAHAGDGLVRVLANLVAEFQEAALLFEVRVVGRGNGVLQTGMVRQRYMEAGHTGIGQQRHKNAQFGLHHTGIAVVGDIITPLGITLLPGSCDIATYSKNLEEFMNIAEDCTIFCSYLKTPLDRRKVDSFKNLVYRISNGENDYTRFAGLQKSSDYLQFLVYHPYKIRHKSLFERLRK